VVRLLTIALLILPLWSAADESEQQTAITESSLASSVGLHVYPKENQDVEQQAQDDYECYRSARGRTGFDPLNPQPRREVAESEIESRAGKESVKDIAGGAAVGAVIGEIGQNDPGEGAAIGGFLGAIRAYKKNKSYKARQHRQAELRVDSEIEYQRLDFKNAFSACLSARGYSVN